MGEDYATIEGNDIAGYVEELGEGVTNFEKGDKVASFTKMRSGVQYGAYAEYSVGIEGCTFKVRPAGARVGDLVERAHSLASRPSLRTP
jgi:NADPH:quinone reductase-like Zn-dependent oxidoreductase